MLMSIELTLCALGLFLAQWINYGFGSNETAAAFEFPIFFQLIFVTATLVFLPFLPESPRWLVAQGKMDEAVQSLVQLGTKETRPDSPEVEKTMTEMIEIARLEDSSGVLWFKSLVNDNQSYSLTQLQTNHIFPRQFKRGPNQNGKRVLMACLISIFQQLAGVRLVSTPFNEGPNSNLSVYRSTR
jgi:hypothetical protein